MQTEEEAFCLKTEYLYSYEVTSIHLHSGEIQLVYFIIAEVFLQHAQ